MVGGGPSVVLCLAKANVCIEVHCKATCNLFTALHMLALSASFLMVAEQMCMLLYNPIVGSLETL